MSIRSAASWCQPLQDMAVPVGAVMFLGGVAVAKGADLSKRCHPERSEGAKVWLRSFAALRMTNLRMLEDPSLAISPKPCNLLGHQTIQSSRDD